MMSSCRASLLAVLCIILYDCTHVPRAGCLSFNLSFSQPQSLADLDRLIYCTGDAYLTLDTLELTRRSRRTNDSTGRATYTQPVRLWDAATGEMANFTTSHYYKKSFRRRFCFINRGGLTWKPPLLIDTHEAGLHGKQPAWLMH